MLAVLPVLDCFLDFLSHHCTNRFKIILDEKTKWPRVLDENLQHSAISDLLHHTSEKNIVRKFLLSTKFFIYFILKCYITLRYFICHCVFYAYLRVKRLVSAMKQRSFNVYSGPTVVCDTYVSCMLCIRRITGRDPVVR